MKIIFNILFLLILKMPTTVYYYVYRFNINNNLFIPFEDTSWIKFFQQKYKFTPRFVFRTIPDDFYDRKNHEKKIKFNDIYHFWWD